MLAFIFSPLGKLILKWGAVALGALLLVIAVLSWIHRHDMRQQAIGAARVQATIDAPVTGWAARLATCKGNAAALQAGLDAQSKAAAQMSEADTAALASATVALHTAQAATVRAQGKVGRVLAPLPAGDACDRLNAVDARLMETVGR